MVFAVWKFYYTKIIKLNECNFFCHKDLALLTSVEPGVKKKENYHLAIDYLFLILYSNGFNIMLSMTN